MITTILVILGMIVFVGVPLFYMVRHISQVIKRNYIFDMKIVKLKGDVVEFKETYKKHALPIIKLTLNGKKYNFLVDTGAEINLLNRSLFDTISNGNVEIQPNGKIQTAGNVVKSEKAVLDFKYINKHFTEEFVLMDLDTTFSNMLKNKKIQLHGVLGSEFFSKHRWSVDFDNMVVWTK